MSDPRVTFHIPKTLRRTPETNALILEKGLEMISLCNEEQSGRILFAEHPFHRPAAEKFDKNLMTVEFILGDDPDPLWGEFLTKKLAEDKA